MPAAPPRPTGTVGSDAGRPGVGRAVAAAPAGVASTFAALVEAARPKQWVKSALVPAAPAAAGVLTEPLQLWRTLVAVVTFTMVAAGGYLLNDAADVTKDRLHPKKRHRPIAAGHISVRLARTVGVVLGVAGMAFGTVLAGWRLGGVLLLYAVLTASYSQWLKHVPVLEMMAVAGGFLLRPVAGAAATLVPMSPWFLTVASFGSLFIIAGKRYAEVDTLAEDAADHRPVLGAYPPSYLRQVQSVCAAVTLMAYCFWAFSKPTETAIPWIALSVVPVTLGVLRYELLLQTGHGGAPEEVLVRDRTLLASASIWLALFLLGVNAIG